MTEIAAFQPQQASLDLSGLAPTATTVSLMEWAQELTAAHQLGSALCGTEFVPSSFRGKPEAAAAAILAGKALGLDPMNALANIFVVSGRPSMYARTMAALVMREGHTIRRIEASDDRVVYEGRRKGDTEWTRVEWNIARAQKAGYTSNKKYQTNPIEMLTAKCQAEISRVIAPDVLTGIAATSVEEVELDDLGERVADSPTTAPAEPKAKRTIVRRQQPTPELPSAVNDAPKDEPELEARTADVAPITSPDPVTEETTPAPVEEPKCSRSQQAKLAAALKANGYETKEDMLRIASGWADRELTSASELTVTEAADFTRELEEDAAAGKNADGVVAEPVDADADAAWMAGETK